MFLWFYPSRWGKKHFFDWFRWRHAVQVIHKIALSEPTQTRVVYVGFKLEETRKHKCSIFRLVRTLLSGKASYNVAMALVPPLVLDNCLGTIATHLKENTDRTRDFCWSPEPHCIRIRLYVLKAGTFFFKWTKSFVFIYLESSFFFTVYALTVFASSWTK